MPHDPPDATAFTRIALNAHGAYEGSRAAKAEFGLEWTLELAIPEGLWSPPGLRVERLVPHLEIRAPQLSGWISKEVKTKPQRLERMVVTVQWEIAERLTAEPRTKAYGALAVLVQSLADVSLVRRLASSVFWPRPQVASAIVLVRPNAAKRAHVGDVLRFRNFLRDLYTQRRKNLRSALAGWPRGRRDKAEVDRQLGELGIDGTRRAEELGLEDHLRLSGVFGDDTTKG